MTTDNTTTVTLTNEQWKLLGFLVRRGAMHELEQQMLYHSHKDHCIPGFVAVYDALSVQLLDVLPQLPPKDTVSAEPHESNPS